MLRKVATATGKVVVATIHQPSMRTLTRCFDTVSLLHRGHVAYHGPVDGVVDYFGATLAWRPAANDNPLDCFMNRLREDATAATRAWRARTEAEDRLRAESEDEPNTLSPVCYGVPMVEQCALLVGRLLVDFCSNPAATAIFLGTRLVIGVFFGAIWVNVGEKPIESDDIASIDALFFVTMTITFCNALIQTVLLVPQIKPVLRRECQNGLYAVLPWYAAYAIFYCALHAASIVLLVVPIYYMCDFEDSGDGGFLFKFYESLTSSVFLGLFLGLLMGAVHQGADFEPSRAKAIAVFMLMYTFCGLLIPYREMAHWAKVVYDINPLQPIYSSVLVAYYEDIYFGEATWSSGSGSYPVACPEELLETDVCYNTGEEYLASMKLDGVSHGYLLRVAAISQAIFAIGAYFAFHRAAYQ